MIVNSPRHVTCLAELDDDELAGAMAAWRDPDAPPTPTTPRCVHLIVNEGPLAGASLEHTHAQLYALPFVPAEVARERERSTAYHERTMGGHLLEDVLVEEVRRRERLVAIDDEAALICPWASRSPFELRLVPRTRRAALRARRARRAPCSAGRCARLRGAVRRRAAAQPLGPDRAAREPTSSTGTSTSPRG